MTTTSRAALASVFATHNPPKPAPTMTTRGRMACGHDPDEAASLDIARVAPVFHVKVPVPGFSVGLCLLSHGHGARVIQEEAQHLARGVRPLRIGVSARGAATRPCVAGSVDVPLLEDCPPARVGVDGAGVGMSSRYPTMMHVCLQARSNFRLRDDVIAVAWMDRGVLIPMEHDGGNNRSASFSHRHAAGALAHGGECGRKIARDAAGEAGMHTHRGVEI